MHKKTKMIDDTCYSLSFDSLEETVFIWILLQTEMVKNFFNSIVFLEDKRPYKKEILQRLNLEKLIKIVPVSELSSIFTSISNNLTNISFDEILKYKLT